eukprot:3618518-Pleurochrysis_carterae.AAC.3
MRQQRKSSFTLVCEDNARVRMRERARPSPTFEESSRRSERARFRQAEHEDARDGLGAHALERGELSLDLHTHLSSKANTNESPRRVSNSNAGANTLAHARSAAPLVQDRAIASARLLVGKLAQILKAALAARRHKRVQNGLDTTYTSVHTETIGCAV